MLQEKVNLFNIIKEWIFSEKQLLNYAEIPFLQLSEKVAEGKSNRGTLIYKLNALPLGYPGTTIN